MRRFTSALGILASIAGLTGCASTGTPPSLSVAESPKSDWAHDAKPDAITGKVSPSEQLFTSDVHIPGSSTLHMTGLSMACSEGKPFIVLVWGFPVGSQASSVLGFRFAGAEGREVPAKFIGFDKQLVDDPAAVTAFMEGAAKSDSLLVRVNSIANGPSTATFATRGGAEAMARLRAACGGKAS